MNKANITHQDQEMSVELNTIWKETHIQGDVSHRVKEVQWRNIVGNVAGLAAWAEMVGFHVSQVVAIVRYGTRCERLIRSCSTPEGGSPFLEMKHDSPKYERTTSRFNLIRSRDEAPQDKLESIENIQPSQCRTGPEGAHESSPEIHNRNGGQQNS